MKLKATLTVPASFGCVAKTDSMVEGYCQVNVSSMNLKNSIERSTDWIYDPILPKITAWCPDAITRCTMFNFIYVSYVILRLVLPCIHFLKARSGVSAEA